MFVVSSDSSPKMMEDEDFDSNNNLKERRDKEDEPTEQSKDLNVLQISGSYPPDVLKALHESVEKKQKPSSDLIDKLVPDSNKIVFVSFHNFFICLFFINVEY